MIDQLTVFLENKPGRLSGLTKLLGENNITMLALMLADTSEFGVARIVLDKPNEALELLRKSGFSASITSVVAVQTPDEPGALYKILEILEKNNINLEYTYCFMSQCQNAATFILKVEPEKAFETEKKLRENGVIILNSQDLLVGEGDV